MNRTFRVKYYKALIGKESKQLSLNCRILPISIAVFVLVSVFFFPAKSRAQNNNTYNIYNGLPSNHVYNSIVDRHGYLWLATPKGVAKFNGYSFKIFGFANGLPREDVWRLVEDKAGRIWLGAITDEIGYIYNDRYYGLKVGADTKTIYPNSLLAYDSGVMFVSSYGNAQGMPDLYTADGKKVTHVRVNGDQLIKTLRFDHADSIAHIAASTINWNSYISLRNNNLFAYLQRRIVKFAIVNDRLTFLGKGKQFSPEADRTLSGVIFRIQNIFICKSVIPTCLSGINISSGEVSKKIDIKNIGINEPIIYVHYDYLSDSVFYCITKTHIIKYKVIDTTITLSEKYVANNLTNNVKFDGTTFKAVQQNEFWGTILCSQNHGAVIKPKFTNLYINDSLTDITGNTLLGSIDDKFTYWWNGSQNKIIKLGDGVENIPLKLAINELPRSIFRLDNIHLLVSGSLQNYITSNDLTVLHPWQNRWSVGIFAAKKISPDKHVAISNKGFEVCFNNLGAPSKYLSTDRFNGLAEDKQHNKYWAFNNNNILVYNAVRETSTEISRKKLNEAGIGKIENIVIDSEFGNVFIRDNEGIRLYDLSSNKTSSIAELENFNCVHSELMVYKRKLIVTGNGGIFISFITGQGKLRNSKVVPALNKFKYIDQSVAINNRLILATDKGTFSVDLTDSAINSYPRAKDILNEYVLIARYKNNVFNLADDDTIKISQDNRLLQFDVINPLANGQPAFTITDLRRNITFNTTKEYLVADAKPGVYNRIRISASDEAWHSSSHYLVLYIEPYWWQTQKMKITIVVALVLLGLLTIAGAVVVTRRLVLRAETKRQLRMELELKSIYAQINPHFIFNSLNSALLLVSKNQMDDAYNHISKFSRLLRSYIKSSRSKFVLLADEIRNLANYIDLQQVRFKNKFDYSITVAENVDINSTKLPSLLLQPFVENAIEHGLLPKVGKGLLKVAFKLAQDPRKLLCIIEDNGIGREESKQNKVPNPIKGESYGELLIKDLVNIFNKYEHMNIKVSYVDKEAPETGTCVTIEIASL